MALPVPGVDSSQSAGLVCLSVVIPSYNRRESLLQLLDAIGRQTYPLQRCEVIVVLDGSDDGTKEAIEQRAWPFELTTMWQPNQGAGRARNAGANAARGDVLVFIDDDVLPGPGWLAGHARKHAEAPGAAVVLGCMSFAAPGVNSVIVAWEAEWYARHFVELGEPHHAFTCWDFFAGNVSIKRDIFQAAGAFDKQFTNYGCEDWELAQRLLKAGHSFAYAPDATAVHRYMIDFDGWQRHAYWDGRSEIRFARKHPEVKSALQLGAFYRGSAWRRLGRCLLAVTPRVWRPILKLLSVAYMSAEKRDSRQLAARLARLVWTYHYWSGMRDELGSTKAVDGFVGFRVPIVVYHRVTNRPHSQLAEYAVSPRTLRRQLRWLRATGRQVVSLWDIYDAYRGVASLPRNAVAITFDDGYADTAEVALPLLLEFGYPATVFVVAGHVGGENEWDRQFGPPAAPLMNWEQLRMAAAAGVEIAGHSLTHARLPGSPSADLERELNASRNAIQAQIQRRVAWFAYPHGEHDERTRSATRSAGYLAAFGFDGGLAGACDDLYALPRIAVNERDGVLGVTIKLLTGDDWCTAIKRRIPPPLKSLLRRLAHRAVQLIVKPPATGSQPRLPAKRHTR